MGRGNNPRLNKDNKWEIKELQRELKDGAQLVSYYSHEPIIQSRSYQQGKARILSEGSRRG